MFYNYLLRFHDRKTLYMDLIFKCAYNNQSWGPDFDSRSCRRNFGLKGKVLRIMIWIHYQNLESRNTLSLLINTYQLLQHRDEMIFCHGYINLRNLLHWSWPGGRPVSTRHEMRGGGKVQLDEILSTVSDKYYKLIVNQAYVKYIC